MYKITLVAKIEEVENMLEKEDMIRLIEAFEAWELLNRMVHELTDGYRISNDRISKLDGIYEVIRRNSRYYTDEDDDLDRLDAVMFAQNITAEEKYELICQKRLGEI